MMRSILSLFLSFAPDDNQHSHRPNLHSPHLSTSPTEPVRASLATSKQLAWHFFSQVSLKLHDDSYQMDNLINFQFVPPSSSFNLSSSYLLNHPIGNATNLTQQESFPQSQTRANTLTSTTISWRQRRRQQRPSTITTSTTTSQSFGD